MTRIHKLGASPVILATSEERTLCGKVGYRVPGHRDEFDTAECHRFEAREEWRGVTCLRCLARKIGTD